MKLYTSRRSRIGIGLVILLGLLVKSGCSPPAQGTWSILIMAGLIGAIATLIIGKIATPLLDAISKPIRKLGNTIYTVLVPRKPFAGFALRNYKKHILRSDLALIENPIIPSLEVPLERAYAPLRLEQADLCENKQADLCENKQADLDLFLYAAETDRCLVLGGPGTGKTTLMKSLLINTIRQRCHPRLNTYTPVFIPLRQLASRQQSVEDAILDAFAQHHYPKASKYITSTLDQGKLLIILDGRLAHRICTLA